MNARFGKNGKKTEKPDTSSSIYYIYDYEHQYYPSNFLKQWAKREILASIHILKLKTGRGAI